MMLHGFWRVATKFGASRLEIDSTLLLGMSSVCDIACAQNPLSSETEHLCSWCEAIVNYQPRDGWNVHLTPEEHEHAIAQFGGPNLHSRKRWEYLLDHQKHGEHVAWARLEDDRSSIVALPCSEEEFRSLVRGVREGRELTGREHRLLQRGIEFHDGSTLRYLRNHWYMDDVRLASVSLEVLAPLLSSPAFQRGWDLPSLILGVASCAPLKEDVFLNEPPYGRGRNDGGRGVRSHYRPLASTLIWLSSRLQIDRNQTESSSNRLPMLAWAYDIQNRLLTNQLDDLQRVFRNALSNHPPGLFETYDTPWLRSWQTLGDTNRYPRTLNWSMRTLGRHLMFRVRTRTGILRLIRVPEDPAAWALMISLSLSPLNSSAGKLLLGLQHNWSSPYTSPAPPSQPLMKSLEFCHEIMNGLPDKIHIEQASALVFGQLGHVYEVRVGLGQHGAPYQIHHKWGLQPNNEGSICIHSGRHSSRLPLGDTMGSVLLSMANDVKASESIQSLEDMLIRSPPFGFPSRRVPESWFDTLDERALEAIRRRHGGARTWFAAAPAQPNEMMEEPPLFGLNGLAFRNRRRRQEGRLDNEWVGIFEQAMEQGLDFPYAEVVEQWRPTVRPYVPLNNEQLGGLFGYRAERMMRRYHHLMPHRRVDDVHDEGDIRDGERRWCEVFARVWEVLSLQPLGSQVTLPNRDLNVLSFERANLTVTLRNRLERNVVGRMARSLGYEQQDDTGAARILVRRDHPRPNARLELSDVLKDAQDRQGVRGAPPRWWNYCDVAAAPNEMPNLRWELQIDLTDDNLPNERNFRGNNAHMRRFMQHFDVFE